MEVGLHRDVELRHYIVVASERWSRLDVAVPRCRRCRAGHTGELVLLTFGIPSFLWGAGLVIDGASGFAGATLDAWRVVQAVLFSLPLVAYFVLRWKLPRPRRHVRRHPEVAALLADGWKYGKAPLHAFDRRIFG